MNKMKRIIYFLFFALGISSCETVDEYLPPEHFNYPIPQTDITEDVNVGVLYYDYTQADWDKNYTYSPKLGEYNALDLTTMDQHKKWADIGGIDYFVFPWNGAGDNDLLNTFITGRSEEVKMVINFNTAHLKATNSSPLTGDKLITMTNELKILANDFLVKDFYFKINNRPVIVIKPVNLSSSLASSINFTQVIPAIRAEFNAEGMNPYIIGEITSGWLPPQRYSAVSKVFDAITLTDWRANGNYGYDRAVFFQAFSDQAFKNWQDSTTVWGIDFIPCIMPGFDDKVMTPASNVYNIERSVDFYKDMANVAKRNMSPSRTILINSWNNFQLGTSIEPTEEYEENYLNVTKEQFKVN